MIICCFIVLIIKSAKASSTFSASKLVTLCESHSSLLRKPMRYYVRSLRLDSWNNCAFLVLISLHSSRRCDIWKYEMPTAFATVAMHGFYHTMMVGMYEYPELLDDMKLVVTTCASKSTSGQFLATADWQHWRRAEPHDRAAALKELETDESHLFRVSCKLRADRKEYSKLWGNKDARWHVLRIEELQILMWWRRYNNNTRT